MKKLMLLLTILCFQLLFSKPLVKVNEFENKIENKKTQENPCETFAHNFTYYIEEQNPSLSSNELSDIYNWALTFCEAGF